MSNACTSSREKEDAAVSTEDKLGTPNAAVSLFSMTLHLSWIFISVNQISNLFLLLFSFVLFKEGINSNSHEGRNTAAGISSQKDEYAFDFAQPSKIVLTFFHLVYYKLCKLSV